MQKSVMMKHTECTYTVLNTLNATQGAAI